MEEMEFHRDPPAEEKASRGKSDQNQTRVPSHGRKPKNESSAKRTAGKKLRLEKEDHVLGPKERRELFRKKTAHQKAAKTESALSRASHKAMDEANEDRNVGTEALNPGMEIGEGVLDTTGDRLYSRRLKSTEQAPRRAERETESGAINLDGDWVSQDSGTVTSGSSAIHVDNATNSAGSGDESESSVFNGKYSDRLGRTTEPASEKTSQGGLTVGSSRTTQKNRTRKEFQWVANQKSDKETANSFDNIGRKFVDKAEDTGGRVGE